MRAGLLRAQRGRSFQTISAARRVHGRARSTAQARKFNVRASAVKEAGNSSAGASRTAVTIDNDVDKGSTVVTVDAQNVPGLLTAMTACFRDLQLEVTRAEVDTSDGAVRDIFRVTDGFGAKIKDEAVLAKLKDALSSMMSEGTPSGRLAWGPPSAARAQILMGALLLVPPTV